MAFNNLYTFLVRKDHKFKHKEYVVCFHMFDHVKPSSTK